MQKPMQKPMAWQRMDDGEEMSVYDENGTRIAGPVKDDVAAMICAAPYLLHALDVLLEAVKRGDHKSKAFRTARAAIAKARGEE